jgi:hypothetical protein
MALAGCSPGVETAYGRSRPPSINGTGVLAGLFRERGHEVRAAVRLTDELSDWADVIVRFAPTPGPPAEDEAKWYDGWLNARYGRRVVYVPHDYDAGPDYWSAALEKLPKDAPKRLRERVEEARTQSEGWENRLPPKPKDVATPEDWFAVKDGGKGRGVSKKAGKAATAAPAPSPVKVQVCDKLEGPWARGVDAAKARVVRHEVLVVGSEDVLLTCDGEALAMSWTRYNGSRVVAVANGSFLLNAALAANPARRPLALRVVDWSGSDSDEAEGREGRTVPKRVAFVEGAFVLSGLKMPSVFDLLKVEPFGVVAAQLLALGLAACLARAPRLGRPKPEAPSGADRPAAHPEALGALLARTGQAREARSILDAYRRWRSGPAGRGSAAGNRVVTP